MSEITEFCTTYSSFAFYKIHCWVLSVVIDVTNILRETGQEKEKNPFFKIYSSTFLDGFERLSVEATFRTTGHTDKM